MRKQVKTIFEQPFFTGINYWDSVHATKMWQEFDERVIDADMRTMRAAGIDSLRVFPLWSDFQPLTSGDAANGIYEFQLEGKPLPDTEAGRSGVSEEMCRRFERFCELAEKHQFQLIVALITGQMSFGGFYPPAFAGSNNAISNPTMCKWQLRYIKYMVGRFKNQSSIIAWDLGNEVNCIADGVENDAFYFWCSSIANAIRVADPTRPVISGFGDSSITEGKANAHEVGEYCDMHTTHPYNIWLLKEPIHTIRSVINIAYQSRIREDISKVPTFVQEFGAIGYMCCSPETEAAFYRGSALSCLAEGCHGVMWWCAFDQGHHGFSPYNWNNIGSQYGFFKADRTEKPVAEENRYIRKFIDALPNGLPNPIKEATIILPRENERVNNFFKTSYILAKQAGLDCSFSYALDPIPESLLYILPCPIGTKAITKNRWNELLSKVENGSRLFMSLSYGFFREIPETFGVCIDYRYEEPNSSAINLNQTRLPIVSQHIFSIRPTTAKVLATDDKGNPVLFENDYGKGKTYLCTLPLEDYLSKCAGVFFKKDSPPYYRVYSQIATGMSSLKISATNSPYICRTEHIIDKNNRYIFLINYDCNERSTALSVADGWNIKILCGNGFCGENVTLRGNDGILLKAEKINENKLV